MKELHIAFATDKNYLKPTCVAIESVLLAACNEEVHYYFYVLMPADEADAASSHFERIKNRYDNCEIQAIGIGDIFKNVSLPIEHITKPTFFRLLLPRLLKQEKCIYLDSDIIVCRDLSELYDIDIEGYEIGGVLAPSYVKRKGYADKIGISSTSQYINAGVLLLNLEQMRQDDFVERALELIEIPFPSSDQDIINRVAYQKIKVLPYKYNVPPALKGYPDTLSDEEIEDAEKRPVILHYAYPEKPWECQDINQADKWWKVCMQSCFFCEFLEEQKESMFYCSVIKKMSLWTMDKHSPEWVEELRKYNKCYVYGAGKIGEKVVNYLINHHVSISGIIVSELKDNKKSVQGIQVRSMSDDIEKDALILVAVSNRYQVSIRRNLFRYGVFYVLPFNEV